MSEFIEEAAHAADCTVRALRLALSKSGPVEALLILPMIEAAAKIVQQADALKAAMQQAPQPVGFLYRDDREALARDGRAFIYAERQTFTVDPDPGCVPVLAGAASE
ncbi:MAG TPA: hypothetical protein PK861_00445 [Thermomonas sp.]|nr:hypothetical protein [Thermomonas sp.]